MTKLEYVLSGKGEKQKRCEYAAFCISDATEEINNYYFGEVLTDFPFPNICIEIIKKEYGKRIEHLKPVFISKLISNMISTQCGCDYNEEIKEAINDFMNE